MIPTDPTNSAACGCGVTPVVGVAATSSGRPGVPVAGFAAAVTYAPVPPPSAWARRATPVVVTASTPSPESDRPITPG